ncbi:MMPL family transporter [Kribbella sp. NPDC050820]|uniref:MMPL family transporter n=1 Tax=Kribbella sp. NPDC050820 TaxID=3155408 RepID=UPI0033DC0979
MSATDSNRVRVVRWLVPSLLIIVWLGAGGWLGVVGSKLAEEVSSGAATYLPRNAEATEVAAFNKRFGEAETLPAIVVYSRDAALTDADRRAIADQTAAINRDLGSTLTEPATGPLVAPDGRAAMVVVPFAGTDSNKISGYVPTVRALVSGGEGLTVHVTGPAGVQADLKDALGAIDLMLVLVTMAVILVILIVVYRSPLLPFLVLLVAGLALGATQGVIYLLAKQDVLFLGAEVQGILNVLVLGAGTDYALLLVARYREELRRHRSRFDAMRVAWRNSLGPIAASGGTVALGLLCLLISDLSLNRDLGPAGAIGIGCALLAMLTLMPAALMLLGRAAFWPRRPAYGSEAAELAGVWSRVARYVERRPRILWIGTALGLVVLALGVVRLDATGIPQNEMIISNNVESVDGQQELTRHFPGGSGSPVIVIADADRIADVAATARQVDGVAAVDPYVGAQAGAPDPGAQPVVVDGLARVDVTLADPPDSKAALDTLERLRDALTAVPQADAKAGGYTAVLVDFNDAATSDRKVIPLLLLVVGLVVALLLRSIVAPLLLLATVALSYLASLGLSALVFRDVFGFSAVDATFPLHAFVFLVALGIDYNIFLMTRVREESARVGTRRGMVIGLTVTGGVITSAGVVLAATFAALAVIPLVLLVQLAFTVAFGVLLDTFVVRSLLVPALTLDVGRRMWWPGRLSRASETPATPPASPSPDPAVLEHTGADS